MARLVKPSRSRGRSHSKSHLSKRTRRIRRPRHGSRSALVTLTYAARCSLPPTFHLLPTFDSHSDAVKVRCLAHPHGSITNGLTFRDVRKAKPQRVTCDSSFEHCSSSVSSWRGIPNSVKLLSWR